MSIGEKIGGVMIDLLMRGEQIALHPLGVEGDPEPVARALGLRPGEGEGNIYLLAPYDHGVFYSPMAKGGLPVVCLPQLYADLYHYERRGREQAAHLRREAMGY